jgi:hypothetical protein
VAGENTERRITAILSADVVGYSRLMGEDEAATLAALKAHRKELIEPKSVQLSLLFNRSKMILVSAVPLWRIQC